MVINNTIVPMISLGGFVLGSSIVDHEDFFSSMLFQRKCKLKQGLNLVSCSFIFQEIGLEVSFNVFSGKISQIEATDPYQGNILGMDLGLGASVEDLLKNYSDDWDGDDNSLWNLNYPGIYFKFLPQGEEFLMSDIEKYKKFKITTIGLTSPNAKGEYDRYGLEWFTKKETIMKRWRV